MMRRRLKGCAPQTLEGKVSSDSEVSADSLLCVQAVHARPASTSLDRPRLVAGLGTGPALPAHVDRRPAGLGQDHTSERLSGIIRGVWVSLVAELHEIP